MQEFPLLESLTLNFESSFLMKSIAYCLLLFYDGVHKLMEDLSL